MEEDQPEAIERNEENEQGARVNARIRHYGRILRGGRRGGRRRRRRLRRRAAFVEIVSVPIPIRYRHHIYLAYKAYKTHLWTY